MHYEIDIWQALPRDQIAPLLNHTERITEDIEHYGEPRYLVGLDVFHQLHCVVECLFDLCLSFTCETCIISTL